MGGEGSVASPTVRLHGVGASPQNSHAAGVRGPCRYLRQTAASSPCQFSRHPARDDRPTSSLYIEAHLAGGGVTVPALQALVEVAENVRAQSST